MRPAPAEPAFDWRGTGETMRGKQTDEHGHPAQTQRIIFHNRRNPDNKYTYDLRATFIFLLETPLGVSYNQADATRTRRYAHRFAGPATVAAAAAKGLVQPEPGVSQANRAFGDYAGSVHRFTDFARERSSRSEPTRPGAFYDQRSQHRRLVA